MDPRTVDTTTGSEIVPDSEARIPALTLLWHPSVARVGERAPLVDAAFGGSVQVSRLVPRFGQPRGRASLPIEHASVSREPLEIRGAGGGVELRTRAGSGKIRVDGVPLVGSVALSIANLEAGVVIELSRQVVLLLHTIRSAPTAPPTLDLVGASDALEEVRARTLAVSGSDAPVLVRGESGTGKELIAHAIHLHSPRRDRPFVAVNVAAVPQGTAASALFGHRRGAFTSAVGEQRGFFQAAEGGTLFLDEIAQASLELQGALLRVLETGEVQALGASEMRRVDVRVIAASDVDLDAATREGRFRLPLLHRLGATDVRLPPLRRRIDDIGRLLAYFLAQAGVAGDLALDSELVAALCRYRWPGNVRELRNLALYLGTSERGRINRTLESWLAERTLDVPPSRPLAVGREGEAQATPDVAPERELSAPAVLRALEQSGFRPGRAARALGISRTTLYAVLAREGIAAKATDHGRADIEREIGRAGGDLARAARELRVSERGLKLRMKALGISGK